jgi:hypothetical protein
MLGRRWSYLSFQLSHREVGLAEALGIDRAVTTPRAVHRLLVAANGEATHPTSTAAGRTVKAHRRTSQT